ELGVVERRTQRPLDLAARAGHDPVMHRPLLGGHRIRVGQAEAGHGRRISDVCVGVPGSRVARRLRPKSKAYGGRPAPASTGGTWQLCISAADRNQPGPPGLHRPRSACWSMALTSRRVTAETARDGPLERAWIIATMRSMPGATMRAA